MEGLQAYAARQADIGLRLVGHFRGLWVPYLPQTLQVSLPIISPQGGLQLPNLTMPNIPLDE
jgi:hypothetical protein